MIKHKYAELIHAWADGATIQVYWTGSGLTQFEWMDVERPDWYIDDCTTMDGQVITWRLRIKPEE
jgi:hypothetical protein